METSQLAGKLQIKPGQKILLKNAPEGYQLLLEPLPVNTQISTSMDGSYDHVQLFVTGTIELIKALKEVKPLFLPSTVIWVMYPKKSSGIKSDLDMMSSWAEPEKYGLRPVASVAVNDTWTALRFKPIDQVKKSGVGNAEIQNSELGKYIDVKNRIITLPPDLHAELARQPSSISFFESLSWTNKKEYVVWILSARQEKTRMSRVNKAAEMLAANQKNPSAK